MVHAGGVCSAVFAPQSVHQRTKLMHTKAPRFLQTFNFEQFSLKRLQITYTMVALWHHLRRARRSKF